MQAQGGGPPASPPPLTALPPLPPPHRVKHLGTAEAEEHTKRWHYHDPDTAHHPFHHRAHLPAVGQGDHGGWGGGGPGTGQTWAGSPSPQPGSPPIDPSLQSHLRPFSSECSSPPHPSPLAPNPSPQPRLPGPPQPGQVADGVGAANALFSIPCPARMTARLGWMKTTPTR